MAKTESGTKCDLSLNWSEIYATGGKTLGETQPQRTASGTCRNVRFRKSVTVTGDVSDRAARGAFRTEHCPNCPALTKRKVKTQK